MSSASGLLRQLPAVWRLQASEDVVARHLVGMPQHVLGIGERLAECLGRRVEPVLLDDVHERQVHVHVVVETRTALVGLAQVARVPGDRLVVLDHRAVVLELGGPAERDPDRLRRPAAADLVTQGSLRQPDFGSLRTRLGLDGAGQTPPGTQQGHDDTRAHWHGDDLAEGMVTRNAISVRSPWSGS